MATFYLPNTNGWQAGNRTNCWMRWKVEQSYNAGTNSSIFTISLQGKNNLINGTFNIQKIGTDSYFSVDGQRMQTFTADDGSLAFTASESWVDYKKNGNVVTWTVRKAHNANGSVSLAFSQYLDFYSYIGGQTYYYTFRDKTATLSTQNYPRYTLSISAGTGSTITVSRTSSPAGAGTGNLSNGAYVYRGDVLKVVFGTQTGYNLGTHTVNGTTFTSGNTHTVTAAVNVVSTGVKKTFTLSISAGTGSTITVKRGTTTLSNGATITYGDVLTVTFGVQTGYNLGTHTVNGNTFNSGNSHTVTGNVNVVSTGVKKTFILSISAGTGSTITVKQGTTTLNNGATVTYGDVLTVTFGTQTGYNLGTHTVNGTTFTSGNTHTVTAAVNVVSTATVKSYNLSINAGTGSTITVNRTSSPLKGATTGSLNNGATIYYNDVLRINFSAKTGYNLEKHTVNDTTFTSGNNHTVTKAVNIVSTASLKIFKLNLNGDSGSIIAVNRTYSPIGGASIGPLSDGSNLYYSDVINISISTKPGYVYQSSSLNGGSVVSPHSVTKDVTITSVTIAAGGYIYISSSGFGICRITIKSQQAWDLYRVIIKAEQGWVDY